MKLPVCLVLLIGLTGCASTADYSVAQDRTAGTVVVSYSTETSDGSPLSPDHANQVATRRCRQIGYSHTALEVHAMQECGVTGGMGDCSQWVVEKTYHCEGGAISEPKYGPLVSVSPSQRRP